MFGIRKIKLRWRLIIAMEQNNKKPLKVIAEASTFSHEDFDMEISQHCALCSNTRTLPSSSVVFHPWFCDECKEAIAFIKDFKESIIKQPSPESPSQGVPKFEIMPL
jgi:hypothetical protein